jgi:gliding motility-associated lipoprotein GldH
MSKYLNAMGIMLFIMFIFTNCKKEYPVEVYHTFQGNKWSRFEKIALEIPVEKTNTYYDLYLYMQYDSTYPFDNLYINVVMDLPSGETRIREYDFEMKEPNGSFKSEFTDGKGEIIFSLRKEIKFNETGTCLIEIEDLIPRIEITGIYRLGILLKRSKPE